MLENLQREAKLCESEIKKSAVLNALGAGYNIVLPESMVNAEMDRLRAGNSGEEGVSLSDADLRLSAIRSLQRRIVINAVVQETHLSLHPQIVRQHVERLATAYENPQEVVQWFYSNRVELAGVEAKVIEEMVIDWLVEQCNKTYQKLTFTDAVNILKRQ